jgi:Ras-related GTP-binding protein A/B
MDLVIEEKRDEIFGKRKLQLEEKSANFKIKCYPTSIWEASLYKAWTQIVSELSPNKAQIEKSLQNFAEACEADEVVLFEKNTFLLCFSYCIKKEGDNANDEQRFEKISHIIKKFKLSCMSSNSSFKSMVIETKNYSAYMDEFTTATYILVILSNKKVSLELLKLNTALCKKSFEDKLNGNE